MDLIKDLMAGFQAMVIFALVFAITVPLTYWIGVCGFSIARYLVVGNWKWMVIS